MNKTTTFLVIGLVTGLVVGLGIGYGYMLMNAQLTTSQILSLQSQVASLQSENTQLYSQVTSLQSQNAQLDSNYDSLMEQYQVLASENVLLTQVVENTWMLYNQLLNAQYQITFLPDEDYFYSALATIEDANSSIYVSMYSLLYYSLYPGDFCNILIDALIDINGRGIDVRVMVDNVTAEDTNGIYAITRLKDSGIDVRLDPDDATTHTKMMIVDGKILFVGSHNWSYYGLQKNNEYSVMIRGDVSNATSYFEALWENGSTA